MELPPVPIHQGMRTLSSSSRSDRSRWVALLAALALVVGLVAGPASAQDAKPNAGDEAPKEDTPAVLKTLALAPDSPPAPDDPFVAVVEADKAVEQAAMARLTASDRAARAGRDSLAAAQVRDAAFAKALAARRVRDDASKQLSVERKRFSDLSIRAYVTGGDVGIERYQPLLDGDTSDAAGGRQIMFAQVLERQRRVTATARKDFATAKRRLAKADGKFAGARHQADVRAARAATLANELADAAAAHRQAVADAAKARTTLRGAASRPTDLVPLDVPIIGLPRLTADDLAGWFASTSYRPRVTTPMTDYAAWFIQEGRAEGIRGDIAFAQATLETGGFANTDSVVANNFSGIGHCDLCPAGWIFPSPHLGVRAQIQLLKSYAVKKPDYASDLVDKRLRGPAGCCTTWGDLTTVWATDPGYGPKVMLIYTSMVDFALKRRAAGLGMEPTTTSLTTATSTSTAATSTATTPSHP
ncbi:MAG: Mannosyl-glycoprotein endo-beta-N-acetylglucosaminidase [Acidimicrobiales bacterium]|nr:Mannosyl-glycoprotein endo-beta-N-acetylglucosaminidase [Acidimicrobiales bacterium]